VRRVVALALLICPAAALSAAAQTSGSSAGDGLFLQHGLVPIGTETRAYVAPEVEHLLGSWGGVRTDLDERGIHLLFDATAEFAGNVSGGVKQGATSANQVAFENDIDWQRLAGFTGLSTHVIAVNRSGGNDSHLFGDNVSPVQEIYGVGGSVLVHLVSAYAEQTEYGGSLDFAAGWMNVENDFVSSPLYCNYMNNDLCGDPKALPGGDIGHSAFPDAVWAGRLRVRPTPDSYVVTGLYAVNQDLYSNADRSGTDFGLPRSSGVYAPVQLAYEPKLGKDLLPGHYVVGFGYDSSPFESFSSALPASAGVPVSSRTGNTQFWALLDQMLVRNGAGDQDGIIALGGYIHNDPENSSDAQQYFAGLLDRGFWRARPADTVGLLFTYFGISGALGSVQAVEAELGLPISNQATGVQSHEMIVEANYNIHVHPGVDFRPDFQYVFRPNAQSNIPDAAVFGFKFNVEF
jgi:porin